MSDRFHYTFVIARPHGGVTRLGDGVYNWPLARGEVVRLTDAAVPAIDGSGVTTSVVHALVEQVVHEIPVRGADAGGGMCRVPPPVGGANPTVYVRLLDEAGLIVPQESGLIPGLCVRNYPDERMPTPM